MARSLTVKHTEAPGTSSLFNVFLAVAFGWLLLSMFAAASASSVDDQGATPVMFDAQ